MEKRIRKYQNLLVTSGWGMNILGIWPVIQFIMLYFLMPDYLTVVMTEYSIEAEWRLIVFLLGLFILCIDLLFRVLVGRAAIREGTGKKHSASCLIWGFFVLIITIITICYYFVYSINLSNITDVILNSIIYFFMLYVNVQLLISAIIVKVCRKKLAAAAQTGCDSI